MTKELDALEVSKQLKDFVLEFVKNGLDRRFIHGSFDIIETALKRLNYIDENRLSDEDIHIVQGMTFEDKVKCIKKLKALEIIKEKFVIPAYVRNAKTMEEYNKQLKQTTFRKDYECRKLTQEEYDSLKEEFLWVK